MRAPAAPNAAPGAATDSDARAAANALFAQECRFLLGAADAAGLPPADLPEVAFAGRSNVGKSSLMNALTGRRTLARTSRTPGRTQQINFFDLGGRLILADLPGFGFARAPKQTVAAWTRLVRSYLLGRPTLRRVVLLIDGRHGAMARDQATMEMLDAAAVAYQLVLTKIDHIRPGAREAVIATLTTEAARHPAAHPHVLATSARTGIGIEELRVALAALSAAKPERL